VLHQFLLRLLALVVEMVLMAVAVAVVDWHIKTPLPFPPVVLTRLLWAQAHLQ
jgi:hypothetical protein